MNYPTLVYKCPGIHQCPNGSFGSKQVSNADEFKSMIAEGWYPTLPQAIEGREVVIEEELIQDEDLPVIDEDPQDEDLPPTREELEEKAKELGIGFNKNTKDETLVEKISSTLEELEA